MQRYRYNWPAQPLSQLDGWALNEGRGLYRRDLDEQAEDLERDSRWPAFFPCGICLVTTRDGDDVAVEKVVGASIVNRFPYIVALSFCRAALSTRHHPRSTFMSMLESGRDAVVQFVPPGDALDRVMSAITDVAESSTAARVEQAGIAYRDGVSTTAPVFQDAYLAYEARLVEPSRDIEGVEIFPQPWRDSGSHRIYFLEINAIQLRRDIARGERQIAWRSLPAWSPSEPLKPLPEEAPAREDRYQKGYTPHYRFPAAGTIAFDSDEEAHGMAIKHLRPQAVEALRALGNDEARWPCFFPSSLGMITTQSADGTVNLMPCGSTTIFSRHPLTVGICVSYAEINARYAPRASLKILREQGWFGCGVAYIDDELVTAIKYAGNVSITDDPNKLKSSGLRVVDGEHVPILPDLPINMECQIVDIALLGTHALMLGEVKTLWARSDLTPQRAMEWYPWADVVAPNA